MILPPPSKRIVYRRHVELTEKGDKGGEVSSHCPNPGAFFWAQRGGLWGNAPRGFLDEQVRRQVAGGIKEDHARRWVNALQYGGLSEAETWDLIRARDCERFGYDHTLLDFDDLPERTFRNAWRMNHNGGVGIYMPVARRIQFAHIKTAVEQHNRKRLSLGRALFKPEWLRYSAAIRHATDVDALARVWPERLPLAA